MDMLHRALELPVTDRADLARQLIISLEPPDFDSNVETAWATEIESRSSQVDRGEDCLRDWRESVERIRNSLRHNSQL